MSDDRLERFRGSAFDESTAPDDPFELLTAWIVTAKDEGCAQHNAMAVATVDEDGTPSVRNVLLRGLDRRGLVFYTNERSQKGRALINDPRCEALMSWLELDRQVRVAGRARPVERELSDAYFAQRDRISQLGAHASRQSEILTDRAELERRLAELDARYQGRDIPRPPHWGGFRITPRSFEFWQGRRGRLHDRLRYLPDGNGRWIIERLNP